MNSARVLAGTDGWTRITFGITPTMATGAKLVIGCQGSFEYRLIFAVCEGLATSSVYPSGADRATTSVPIEPAAPTRFSTTVGCPVVLVICSPTERAITSTTPPGG